MIASHSRRLCPSILVIVIATASIVTVAASRSLAGEMGARPVAGTCTVGADLSTLEQALDRADVQAKLLESGITREDARARLATLTPGEMHEAAQQIERAGSGGDALGFVAAVLLIVLLVLLILVLLGKL